MTGGAESPHSIQNFGVRRLDCALIPAARRRININAKLRPALAVAYRVTPLQAFAGPNAPAEDI